MFWLVSILLIGYGYLRRSVTESVGIALSVTLTMFLVWLIKKYTVVPRPEGALIDVSSYAFPSGHAAGSVCVLMIVWYLTRDVRDRYLIRSLTLVLAFAISISRLLLVVHTWEQVLAGALIGALVPLGIWNVGHSLRHTRLNA